MCVGEQPLHAVPLLKFHNKDSSLNAADDYSMPHWINLSFYSTNKKIAYSKFIPRIKLPPLINPNDRSVEEKESMKLKFISDSKSDCIHNSLFDYDAYDAQIFQLPVTTSMQRSPRSKKTSVPSLDGFLPFQSNEWAASTPPPRQPSMRRKLSDPDILLQNSSVNMSNNNSPPTSNYSSSLASVDKMGGRRSIISNGSVTRPSRALINPFDPSHVTIKLTANRRRWTHIFPKGPTGVLVQQHHYQAVPAANSRKFDDIDSYNHTSNCSMIDNDEYMGIEGVVDKLLNDTGK